MNPIDYKIVKAIVIYRQTVCHPVYILKVRWSKIICDIYWGAYIYMCVCVCVCVCVRTHIKIKTNYFYQLGIKKKDL